MHSILHKKTKGRARKRAIDAGAYDGRLRTRVIINKRKNQYKKLRKEKFKIQNL